VEAAMVVAAMSMFGGRGILWINTEYLLSLSLGVGVLCLASDE
jgi:hypothetical protein